MTRVLTTNRFEFSLLGETTLLFKRLSRLSLSVRSRYRSLTLLPSHAYHKYRAPHRFPSNSPRTHGDTSRLSTTVHRTDFSVTSVTLLTCSQTFTPTVVRRSLRSRRRGALCLFDWKRRADLSAAGVNGQLSGWKGEYFCTLCSSGSFASSGRTDSIYRAEYSRKLARNGLIPTVSGVIPLETKGCLGEL